MSFHPLKIFEIQKYYQNEPRFRSVFSRNNLLDKYKSIETRNSYAYSNKFNPKEI